MYDFVCILTFGRFVENDVKIVKPSSRVAPRQTGGAAGSGDIALCVVFHGASIFIPFVCHPSNSFISRHTSSLWGLGWDFFSFELFPLQLAGGRGSRNMVWSRDQRAPIAREPRPYQVGGDACGLYGASAFVRVILLCFICLAFHSFSSRYVYTDTLSCFRGSTFVNLVAFMCYRSESATAVLLLKPYVSKTGVTHEKLLKSNSHSRTQNAGYFETLAVKKSFSPVSRNGCLATCAWCIYEALVLHLWHETFNTNAHQNVLARTLSNVRTQKQ